MNYYEQAAQQHLVNVSALQAVSKREQDTYLKAHDGAAAREDVCDKPTCKHHVHCCIEESAGAVSVYVQFMSSARSSHERTTHQVLTRNVRRGVPHSLLLDVVPDM